MEPVDDTAQMSGCSPNTFWGLIILTLKKVVVATKGDRNEVGAVETYHKLT